ncbi:ATP-dependent 6-phosphofructokinase [Meiothermus sp. CFH 77666]|uniref:ATP-dependent 6-phosphofructokinase n=1 Tax=Meiothermus sp. CFH 77666 TaxID=2817942 RepID=UPI001AA01149|nr:ATP-dependent 6-phosphofructokinase [Meiothermus sp. CFH 77666]
MQNRTPNTQIPILGPARFQSPLQNQRDVFVEDNSRVLLASMLDELQNPPATFELAGPRRQIFFNPAEIACGIVTCGGLCPGLNDVIRSVVMTLSYSYGVKRIYGFRYGYAGLAASQGIEPLLLTPEMVQDIHDDGGTMLGSSRGPQEPADMIERLQQLGVRILFAVGGDGTLRGASALAQELQKRNLAISVIGIPKTIDNDIEWIERSFGVATAVEEATRALEAAHAEARGAYNGIGLVKLMGRHSGFITAHATLANADVNFCLVPEVPFSLEGFLAALEERLLTRHHAVIALAEGAGQDLIEGEVTRDASGNVRLKDIGHFLKEAIGRHFDQKGLEATIKYIDPSYIIRSVPANAVDSEYCLALGQHAVHAGMSGRTDMMVGYWNQHFTHVPIAMATQKRKQIDPQSELWQQVLGATGQPRGM